MSQLDTRVEVKASSARRNARSWQKLLAAAGIVFPLSFVAASEGRRRLVRWFQHRYFRETYAPVEMTADHAGIYPATVHLDNVPWIATREWYCQANSLAMIARQHGAETTTGHCSFLMGFTYGAVEVPGQVGFSPFSDPEPGFGVAAPYFGLVRRYLVSRDPDLYLRVLRTCLARGYAVRVALDVGVVYGLGRELPHSDLLVGYDEQGFHYYETVCIDSVPPSPLDLAPGEKGLWISNRTLLEAVSSQAQQFGYPWRYNLTIFESGPVQRDLRPIWTRNGNQLIGGVRYGPRQGADAIDKLATSFERLSARIDLSQVRWELEAAVFTRRDNAAYLRSIFSTTSSWRAPPAFSTNARPDTARWRLPL